MQKEINSLTALDIVVVEELIATQIQNKKIKIKEEEKLHLMNEKAHQEKL